MITRNVIQNVIQGRFVRNDNEANWNYNWAYDSFKFPSAFVRF